MKSVAGSNRMVGGRLVRLSLVLALGLSQLLAASTPVLGNQLKPALVLTAPLQVAVGDIVEITLSVTQVSDIAGYETAVLFDTTAAEFAGLQQRQNDLTHGGRDVSPLAAVGLTNGVAIGLFSCPEANCVTRQGASQAQGAHGTVLLARLLLIANRPGTLEIKLDATQFVDAAGKPVTVYQPQTSVSVQVGNAGSNANTVPQTACGAWIR